MCQVEYLEITKSTHKMRAPSFKGLRDDKLPGECVLERPHGAGSSGRKPARAGARADGGASKKKTTARKKATTSGSTTKKAPTRR